MVRPSYRLNFSGDDGGNLRDDPRLERDGPPGGRRFGPEGELLHVGWSTFFDFGDGLVGRPKRIDNLLSTALFSLPRSAIAAPGGPESLAQRNLLRHVTFELPSGQRVARHMRAPVLSPADLDSFGSVDEAFDVDFRKNTPLWPYILFEAAVMEEGLRLGPVGGRIVSEVIIGLLEADRRSYLSAKPDWKPTHPSDDFRMTDFLSFAEVAGRAR